VGTQALDQAPLRLAGGVVRIGTREIPVEAKPGEAVQFTVPSPEWAGQEVTLAARVRGASGRWSAWSNEISLRVEATVPPPRTLTAQLASKGVELRWEPATPATIARRLAGGANFEPIQEAMAPPYVDGAVELNKSYEYRVQAKNNAALSEPSTPAAITFEDKFPPPVPTGLDAVAGLNSIELSWDLVDDSDFSAFLVYRAAPNAEFAPLGAPTALPSISDRTAQPSIAYHYAVASVDRVGNISARSMPVEITLPPQ
jgi:fibronectin type 3 domain-containing protein